MILPSIVFVLLGVIVLSALLVYNTSLNAVRAVERAHERNNEYTSDLLDRLMAMDYNTYKAHELLQRQPDTGYVEPESESELDVERHTSAGFGSRLGLMALRDVPDPNEEESETA